MSIIQENIDYLSKDNQFKEVGNCPVTASCSNAYRAVIELAEKSKLSHIKTCMRAVEWLTAHIAATWCPQKNT